MEHKTREWLRRFSRWFEGDGKRRILLIVGAVGIGLLALSEWIPKRETETVATLTTEQFVEQTEQRLESIVSSIEGAGRCRVLLTLDNGVEYVYATEERTMSDRQEDTDDGATRLTQSDDSERAAILVDTDSGREGLLVTEIQPTVRGVVVVCEGGDNEAVIARVTEAVTVALELSSKKVCVTKLS